MLVRTFCERTFYDNEKFSWKRVFLWFFRSVNEACFDISNADEILFENQTVCVWVNL